MLRRRHRSGGRGQGRGEQGCDCLGRRWTSERVRTGRCGRDSGCGTRAAWPLVAFCLQCKGSGFRTANGGWSNVSGPSGGHFAQDIEDISAYRGKRPIVVEQDSQLCVDQISILRAEWIDPATAIEQPDARSMTESKKKGNYSEYMQLINCSAFIPSGDASFS